MKKLLIVALSAACGCTSVEVVNHGEEIVEGKVVSKGWEVSYWQHWMVTKTDALDAIVKPNDIAFSLNKVEAKPDATGLAKVVETSFAGVNELTAKVCAAVATSGGSVAGDAVAKLVGKYLAAGGKVENAKVSCKDGNCTITDGCTTCSEAGCATCHD